MLNPRPDKMYPFFDTYINCIDFLLHFFRCRVKHPLLDYPISILYFLSSIKFQRVKVWKLILGLILLKTLRPIISATERFYLPNVHTYSINSRGLEAVFSLIQLLGWVISSKNIWYIKICTLMKNVSMSGNFKFSVFFRGNDLKRLHIVFQI